MATLTAVSPLDERSLGEFSISEPAQIQAQLASARRAFEIWRKIPVQERLQRLAPLKNRLLENLDSLCETLHASTGKVYTEALLGDVYPVLDLLTYYQQRAPRLLRSHAVYTSPLAFPGATARIERQPYGVVAVISPWNYPFQLAMAPLLTALIAGNAVILKPSELCLPVGQAIIDLFAGLDLPEGLVQGLVGAGETGQHLIDAGPDLVFFTGGLSAGRAVMQRAARHPIPVLLELGGKDAMLVFEDADLQRASAAALYGAFCNSGQVCISVERLYVQQAGMETFLSHVLEGLATLQVGRDPHGDLGAMTSPRQRAIVQAHYDDAIAQGAKASGPLRQDGNVLYPVVLWNVHHGMKIMREETFGPLLPIMTFNDEAEAISLANDSDFGLNASVWSLNIAKAEAIARQLQVGNWAINDVLKNVGHSGLPFGGVKRSGFGRYHGAEGLMNFTYPVSGLTNRNRLAQEPNWFPYSRANYQHFKGFLDFLHGDGGFLRRSFRNRQAIQAFAHYATFDVAQHWQNLKLLFSWTRDDR